MNPLNLLQSSYWLNQPGPLAPGLFWAALIFFSILVIASVALKVVDYKKDRLLEKGLRKIAKFSGWLGVLGWLILFFRYQFVPLLSLRAFYLVWLAVALAGVYFIIKYFTKSLPELQRREEERRRIEKYLP